jgi:hypothetical protein
VFLWLKGKTKIEALQEGELCVVEGRVVADRELGVPGTQLKCVYYHQIVDKWDRGERGRGRKMWIPIHADEKAEAFTVEDATGRVWIAADAKSLDVSGAAEELGPYGKKGNQRFIARLIRVGDVVRVRGVVGKPMAAEPGELLVMRPGGKKQRLEILFKKRAK